MTAEEPLSMALAATIHTACLSQVATALHDLGVDVEDVWSLVPNIAWIDHTITAALDAAAPEDSADPADGLSEHHLLGNVCSCGDWSAGCGHDVAEQWRHHADAARQRPTQQAATDRVVEGGLRERVEALRPILDRIAEDEEHVSFVGGPEQAARFVASVAWPLERRENRDSWAPRLIAEPDMLNQEGWRARARLQAAIDTCRDAIAARDGAES